MRKLKTNKGITLIALVITIIILLILAGVSIAMLTGENGIISKAMLASEESSKSQALEELRLKVLQVKTDKQGSATLQDIVDALNIDEENEYILSTELATINGIIPDLTDTSNLYVNYKGYWFEINLSLEVTIIEKTSDDNNQNSNPEVHQKEYIQDGLLLHYDAKNNTSNGYSAETTEWNNLANSENKGILNGNPVWNEDSLYFDGIDDYIDAGKIGLENNKSFTYECVISFDNSQKSKTIMGLHYDSVGGASLGIDDGNSNYLKYHLNSYDSQRINSREPVNDGEKHQIIATYNSEESKLYLYIDGELDNSATIQSSLTYPDISFCIGRWGGGQSQYYNGNIYNVLVYNRYLTEEDVLNNYKTDVQNYSLKDKTANNLLVYYDAKNNTGSGYSAETTEWKNLATTENNGILNGNPIWNEDSLYFDGENDYIDSGKVNLENYQSFTYECTLSYAESQKMKALISIHNNACGGSAFGIDDNDSDYLKFHLNSYDYQRINSTVKLNDGKKHNIIATYQKGESKLYLYIDGKLNKSVVVSSVLTYPDLSLNIGRWVGGQSQYYKGNIYSVKVYNKYLTEQEIQVDYQNEKNRYELE